MTRWNWKRWAFAIVTGSAMAGSFVSSASDDMPKAGETITLKYPGQPDRIVTVVKSVRKADGSLETEVKDGKSGETFTLVDPAPENKIPSVTPAKPAQPVAPIQTVAAKPTAPATLPPLPVPLGNKVAAPAAKAPVATQTPMPPMAEAKDKRLIGNGKVFNREPETPVSDKPGILGRVFGKRPTPTTMPATSMPVTSPGTARVGAEPPRVQPAKPAVPTAPTRVTPPTPVVPPVAAPSAPSSIPLPAPSKPVAPVFVEPSKVAPAPKLPMEVIPIPIPVKPVAPVVVEPVKPIEVIPTPVPVKPVAPVVVEPVKPNEVIPTPVAVKPVAPVVVEPVKPIPVPAPAKPTLPPVAAPTLPAPIPTIPSTPMSSVPVQPAGDVRPAPAAPVPVQPAAATDMDSLLTALKDAPAPSARLRAVKQLSNGPQASTEAVKSALFEAAKTDLCAAVKADCIDALAKLGCTDPAFITYLKSVTKDGSGEVRLAAKGALEKLGR